MRRIIERALVLAPVSLIVLSALLTGCSSSTATKGDSILAAWDMMPLAQAAQSNFSGASGMAVATGSAAEGIAGLQSGRCDALILGRDPTPQEMQGLKDEVIGHDAVTILIDQNSWKGGEWWVGNMPSHRTSGLRNLTTADLKGLFSFPILQPGQRWKWTPTPPASYDAWVAYYDNTGAMVGQGWVPQDESVPPPFVFPQGKYDTQSALYQALGLDETAITSAAETKGFTAVGSDTEEQVLGSQYQIAATGDFVFKIGFSSLRTAKLAVKNLSVNVVSIDGVDPVATPQSVYDGTYPLSRKIHLLTGENCSETDGLAEFLLSPEGQKVVQDAGYLPLPAKS